MSLQTEFSFQLPHGLVGPDGQMHREGSMRMALAMDEIEALQDPRVQANEGYLPVVLLSRVVIRLGGMKVINAAVIEGLFSADMAYLEDLYMRINSFETTEMITTCPHCRKQFAVQVAPLGNGGSNN